MAKALRTIPVILDIAAEMRRLAPGALLVNFTNPSDLVTEALFRHMPEVPAVGLCNSPITTKMEILKSLGRRNGEELAPERGMLAALGLNHLCWYRGFTLDGVDVWPQVIETYTAALREQSAPEWPADLIETLRMLPNSYLQYYYHTSAKLAAQAGWPPSRADQVIKIEADLLAEYAEPDRVVPPPDLMKRGGAYFSTLATQVINAHANNLGQVEVVNVRHNGAVPGWPADWVLELPCRIDRAGIHPLPAQPLPPVCFGLLAQVKAYELLTVDAAVNGDREAAYQALLAHPLGPEAPKVQTVLEDMLRTNRRYLPRFFGGDA